MKFSTPALDLLNAKPESYPKVMILAFGKVSGRKSSSQKLPEDGSVHVFLAVPFKPWMATRLINPPESAECAASGAAFRRTAHTRLLVPKIPHRPRASDAVQRGREARVQSHGEDSNWVRILASEVVVFVPRCLRSWAIQRWAGYRQCPRLDQRIL